MYWNYWILCIMHRSKTDLWFQPIWFRKVMTSPYHCHNNAGVRVYYYFLNKHFEYYRGSKIHFLLFSKKKLEWIEIELFLLDSWLKDRFVLNGKIRKGKLFCSNSYENLEMLNYFAKLFSIKHIIGTFDIYRLNVITKLPYYSFYKIIMIFN